MRYVILDTETSGLSPKNGHRIIELAMLEMADRKLTPYTYHGYFNPERHIEESATAVHGITDMNVSAAPYFKDDVKNIIDMLEGSIVIAHNAKFDVEFINSELVRAGYHELSSYVDGVVDTLAIAKEKYPKQKNSLDALCDRLGVDRTNRGFHGALIDCELLFEVYLGLTEEEQEKEVITIERVEPVELPVIYASQKDIGKHNNIIESIS